MLQKDDQFIAKHYRLHGPVVLRRAERILGNRADAEEVLQDVFIHLARSIHTFDNDDTQVLHWLYRVTTNRCLDTIRKTKRRSQLLRLNCHSDSATRWVPDDAIFLQAVLEECSDREYQAAIYAYFDGMPHHQVAELLGVSRRTVGNLLDRVRERAQKLASSNRLRSVKGGSS
ncbi:MAG: sigma-70 family RNA polymerase sigma factor [Myxococcota bacterium]